MEGKNSNNTPGEDSWLTYSLENYLAFLPYQLGLLATLIILYFPVLIGLIFFYIGGILVQICKIIGNLPANPGSKQWIKPLQRLSFGVHLIGRFLHGYEVCGMDNIPEGPAVIVLYHGSMPLDFYLFLTTFFRMTGRLYHVVVDHFFFLLPGLKSYFTIIGCSCANRKDCVSLLKKGHLLVIAPGGLREQNYGDNNYNLIWKNRQGFAHIATDAKVPVIPVFTQNIREAYRVYGNIGPLRWLYERTRLLIFPVLGPFPVKLRTHVGEPIPYDPNITPTELFEKVKFALESLIEKHQKIPGSILSAFWERFQVHHKEE